MNKSTGYIVRSKQNPVLILCTDGEFHTDTLIGPGRDLSAKVYKTTSGVKRAMGDRKVIVQPIVNGVPVLSSWEVL